MATELLVWWTLLCAVAAVNVALWLALAATGAARGSGPARWQLLLSAGYVAGCAWRSVFPVFDVPRLAVVDTWASSVLVGRSVATVAELCFAAQWALLLRAASRPGQAGVRRCARFVVPAIVLAELCSWHAVLTTSNLGHVVEEALWGASAVAVAWAAWRMRSGAGAAERRVFGAIAVAAGAYALYMFAVDVPTYALRWWTQAEGGHAPLSLLQGVVDAASRWHVSHRWEDWRGEVVWMTAYFSVGVWSSLALVQLSRRALAARLAEARR